MIDNFHNIKVSVIIAVYNEEEKIKRALESIINQTHKNLEIIVVNDGSIDNTLTRIKEIVDERIILINNKRNNGISKSRNQAINLASGKYIAIFDADDYSLPSRIEKQVKFLETNPDIVMCGTWALMKTEKSCRIFSPPTSYEKIKSLLYKATAIVNSTIMVKTDIMKKYLFDEKLKRAEDYDLILRVAKHYKISNIPEVLLEYETSESYKYALREHYWKIIVRWRAFARYGYGIKSLLWIFPSFLIPFIPFNLKLFFRKILFRC